MQGEESAGKPLPWHPCMLCVLLADWESRGQLGETVEKGFQAVFDFSFFSYSITMWSVDTQFSKIGLYLIFWDFFPTATNITLFFSPALFPGLRNTWACSVQLWGADWAAVCVCRCFPLTKSLCLCPPAALRSRSGRSIINGNWAIDRPGRYEGGGTMFTYRRPNEISSTAGESFLADGPTNEVLDVYVS